MAVTRKTRRYNNLTFEEILDPKSIPKTQAERIIEKFGSVPNLHAALNKFGFNKDISAIYRWLRPYRAGKEIYGGVIPKNMETWIMMIAHNEGILITPEDLDPRTYIDGKPVLDESQYREEVIKRYEKRRRMHRRVKLPKPPSHIKLPPELE